jgi:hypothetical protein
MYSGQRLMFNKNFLKKQILRNIKNYGCDLSNVDVTGKFSNLSVLTDFLSWLVSSFNKTNQAANCTENVFKAQYI